MSAVVRWVAGVALDAFALARHLPRIRLRTILGLPAAGALAAVAFWQPELLADVLVTRAQRTAALVTDALEQALRTILLPPGL